MQRRKLKSTSKADFEVAVVGGGPSGSTAALVLARSGARVIVIDKAQFPRDKACGDVIGPKAVRILETLGVSRPADAIDLSDVAIVGPSGAAIRLPSEAGLDYSGIGWSCPRTSFDAHRLQAAVTHGACVRTAKVEKIGSDARRFELRLSDRTEWLGRGLQSLAQRFDSARRLFRNTPAVSDSRGIFLLVLFGPFKGVQFRSGSSECQR